MVSRLRNIAKLTSGIYKKPDLIPDALYLQATHFDQYGSLDPLVEPQVSSNGKIQKHLLQDEDILFAAKGLNNFGVVYQPDLGAAVASSSFIVIRIQPEYKQLIIPEYLAWFLGHSPEIKKYHQRQLGTTVPSISLKKLGEVRINVPAIEKQEMIVKVQQLRNKQKELALELEEARENQIKQLLINAINNHYE